MKKLGTFLLSSMLLLMNSCSETSSPGLEWLGDEVAVRFTATMQPSVEILPTRAMIDELPTEKGKNQVGIYGLLTGSTDRQESEDFEWQAGTNVNYHQEMENKQYLIGEGNTLSPAYGKVDYHPSRAISALAAYAYWPYDENVEDEGCISVDIAEQTDILYTGKVLSILNEETKTFDPIQLPFKHAMGAIAFRFYTDDPLSPLVETTINTITLNTNYNTEGVKMCIADGTFITTGESGVHVYNPNIAITAEKTEDPVGGQMMPADGETLEITDIGLTYDGGTKSTTISGSWVLTPGTVQVLNIKCIQKSNTPTLIVDKSTYTTRSGGTDDDITFVVEEDYTE